MSDSPQVTAAEAWRSPRKQGFATTLPSGNVCQVKRIGDLRFMLRSGRVPNPLMPYVAKALDEGKDVVELREMDRQEQIAMLDFIDATVVEVMLDPKVMIPPDEEDGEPVDPMNWEPPPGFISMMDLTTEDKLYLYQVALGGTTDVGQFRQIQSRVMASVPAGDDVPVSSVKSGGTKRTRGGSSGK